MSATGTPVPEGLGLADVQAVITTCLSRLISFDLVEFNPLLGDARQTLENIFVLLKTVLTDKSLD
jgi:arginase family enzyme